MTQPSQSPEPIRRTTETALALPSFRRTMQLLGRGLRLRCPHCGHGAVLGRWAVIRDRCRVCRFRYTRSEDNYFGGALFCSIMLVEAIFGIGLGTAVIATWPKVPWDMITYVAAIGMFVLAIAIQPIGRVAWLTLDVIFRPTLPEECD